MPIDFTKPEPQLPQWVAPASPPLTFTPLPESYYKHSGKAPLLGLLAGLGGGLLIGIGLAFAYSYVIVYLPFVYLRVLATIGYGFALAFGVGFGLQTGKIRNTPVALAIVGVVTLISFYFVWGIWVFAEFQRADNEDVTLIGVLTSPFVLWEVIHKINETGVWGFRGTNVSGIALWVVWIVEAVIIFSIPLLGGWGLVSDPFCETCDRWTEEENAVREFKRVASPAELKEILRRKDYGALLGHPRRAGDEVFYRASVHKCKNCNVFHVLKVEEITLAIDQNGKANESKTPIVENLLINASEMAALGS